MTHLRGRRPQEAAGRGDARRRAAAVAAVLAVTAGLAVMAAVLTRQAWAPVVISVLVGLPGLYAALLAVPGVVSPVGFIDQAARGRLVAEWDPLELGVHHVIGGGPLPAYVARPHDEVLRRVLDPSVAASRLVVLRGGSSSGKTRAAWEAVSGRLAGWWLDYPRNPAALRARLDSGVASGMVLWLGELRQYVDADGGEEVLGRVADLLNGEGRLIVTTAWPEDLAAYAAAALPGARPAPAYAAAGRLLSPLPELTRHGPAAADPARGGIVDVPGSFTDAELQAAVSSGDQVLAQAAGAAKAAGQPGQVAQYLAGVPDLLARYSGPGGDPFGQAVITAAVDAARLGHASPLPAVLLQEAAAGYLTEGQRATAGDGWQDRALEWASQELRGAVRALQPVPPRQGTGIAGYQVADYLEQHGRATRQGELGSASLWDALAARTASAADLTRTAESAQDRGLYRHASALLTKAAGQGDASAAADLIQLLRTASAGSIGQAADLAADRASLDDPHGVAELLEALREAGAEDAAAALACRAAAHASLDDPHGVALLLGALHEAGFDDTVTTLLARDPAAHTRVDGLDSLFNVMELLGALREAGAEDAAAALACRAAAHASLDSPRGVAVLLGALREAGFDDAAAALACRAAAHASLDSPRGVAEVLGALHEAGFDDAVAALLARDPAAHIRLDGPDSLFNVAVLLGALCEAGADDAVAALLARDPAAHASLDDPLGVAELLRGLLGFDDGLLALLERRPAAYASLDIVFRVARMGRRLRDVGAADVVAALLARDPAARASLDDPRGVAMLLGALRRAGFDDAVAVLLARDPAAHASLGDPHGVAELLEALREAGADDAVTTLLARDPATRASLGDPHGVALLLRWLREAADADAVAVLLARDPAGCASFGNPLGVAELLEALREAGADDAADNLTRRADNAGATVSGRPRAHYQQGREPDGAPSRPWIWERGNGPLSDTSASHSPARVGRCCCGPSMCPRRCRT
jgi:uncharacterized protein YidB (DUF937 family)